MRVDWIFPYQVDAVFERFGEGFQKASDRCGGEENVAMLWQMCRNGNAMLLVATDGTDIKMASVWRFENWDKGTIFRCITLAGDGVKAWTEEGKKRVYERARLGGASRIIFAGREGWPRIFDDAKKIRSVFEITL